MQVSGEIHPAYSTTTTGHIYFRNVSQNSLIAECTDPLGTTLADSDWTCTNKLTGQNINFAAFNGLVSSYKTQ